jgi:type VI secretion system secreted protein VgrG
MTTFATTNRLWSVATPLPGDTLILVGFWGSEGISQLFRFHLDLVAQNSKEVPFDKLLGQKVVVSLILSNNKKRYFSGICSRVTQGGRDSSFTAYRMEVVPQFWLLTRRAQSRIFQHVSIPDILKKVLAGFDVDYQIQGTFPERDYCVQYRETDFNFASRLMEEEGIYYFFKHTDSGHKLVLANAPQGHPDLPEQSKAIFQEMTGGVLDDRVHTWEKAQELRSGKVTLWDHCFELPHKHLEADATIPDSVKAGKVTHKLKVGGNDKLELYDYPGEYAQRFDGVDKGGGDRAADIKKIFDDNKRTVSIRMEEEAAAGVMIRGAGNCRSFVSGHKFTLEQHFNGDGPYVLVSVEHSGRPIEGNGGDLAYQNSFTCIPAAVVFRPSRRTPKPFVQGTQTAVVVGPKGQEIFTDKYGRVKVQFHWDREGQYDANSSCWIRVGTIWAGKGWGIVNVPRIGHEVIVAFEEGDPDRPIIIGSVFNADHMPADKLPGAAMVSGLKSNSTPGGGGYNGLVFNDTKGKEGITLHGQYDMSTTIEHDDTQHVKNDRGITVDGKHTETIKKDTTIHITEGNLSHDVVAGTAKYHVKGAVEETYEATQKTTVTAAVEETYNATQQTTVKQNIAIQSTAADIVLDGKTQIKLVSGDSSILLKADGTIQISGKEITISGTAKTQIGVGNQTVTSDTAQVAVSGAAIASSATGKHEITGAVVKIN